MTEPVATPARPLRRRAAFLLTAQLLITSTCGFVHHHCYYSPLLGTLAVGGKASPSSRFSSSSLSSTADDNTEAQPEQSSSFGFDKDEDIRMVSIRIALSKMQTLQEPDFFSSSSSNTLQQFHKKLTKTVQVAPSSIPSAGMGLFAVKNIKAGMVVGLMPVHALGVDMEESSVYVTVDPSDEAYFSQEDKPNNYLHYLIGNRPLLTIDVTRALPGSALFLDVNPNRPIMPGWTGHLVNDGATITSNTEKGVLTYYEYSKLAKNCVHIPFGPSPILATVTTRKVKKGQELFTTYGCSYWLDALLLMMASTENEKEESTDITEEIQEQVKETAKDLFAAMQSVRTVYAKEEAALQAAFDKI